MGKMIMYRKKMRVYSVYLARCGSREFVW